MTQKTTIPEEIKDLVIARLDSLPQNKKISIGSAGEFTKNQLMEHVKKGDEIGQKIVEIELEFLRAMKGGILLGLSSNN